MQEDTRTHTDEIYLRNACTGLADSRPALSLQKRLLALEGVTRSCLLSIQVE